MNDSTAQRHRAGETATNYLVATEDAQFAATITGPAQIMFFDKLQTTAFLPSDA
jgi:hypothetical protein